MLAFAAFTVLYLAAFNSMLAFTLGTCTQGSADELMGGAISLALYLVSALCLVFARQTRLASLAILPPLPFIAWQIHFTFRLTYGHLVLGQSACEVIHTAPYELDGRENFFIGLWTVSCLVALCVVALAFYRGMPTKTPEEQ